MNALSSSCVPSQKNRGMAYHWDRLRIQNYKSIKDLHLECGSINVFIGPPNAGKSNILEAMDVVNLPFYQQNHRPFPEMEGFDCRRYFRVDSPDGFFNDLSKPIQIEGQLDGQFKGFYLTKSLKTLETGLEEELFEWKNWTGSVVTFNTSFDPISENAGYRFLNTSFQYTDRVGKPTPTIPYGSHLAPPFGLNLGSVLEKNDSLLEFAEETAKNSGFELAIDKSNNQILVQIRVRPSVVVSLPFSALSDTFRRMLFFTAAVRTASAPILTLEEPEALSYPPFISNLAQEIIQASSQKQFFISTHSPYLLNEFIDHVPHDKLAVFVCHFSKEGAQTKARRLRPEELSEVQNYGVDLFFNLDPYLHDPSEHSA